MTTAYLNGEYIPLEKAQISALDRGFLFGDGVYEVIPFYQGHGVGLTEHLARLDNSLLAIDLPAPLTHLQWLKIFEHLLAEVPEGDYKIYLQISRGAAPLREFTFPETSQPTVFAFATPFIRGASAAGIKAVTYDDIRWRDCFIKSVNLLPGCIATQYAKKNGAQEAILYRDGIVTEGASSNIFIVRNGEVYTMPANGRILNGITRLLVIQALKVLNIPIHEVEYSLDDLRNADEIWSTSSTREIGPVIQLDGQLIGNGKPGPVWQQISAQYAKLFTETPHLKSLIKEHGEPQKTLLKFPCEFPIKIMGKNTPELEQEILKILTTHCSDFAAHALKSRLSKDENYRALTATINAQSKEQLDAIYHALTANKLVLMAL